LDALLGRGARYSGELKFQGRVRLDGHFAGSIRTEDTLEIGESGVLEGEVEARELIVAGRVEGSARAHERLILQPTGSLKGKLDAGSLDSAPGARIDAQVKVGR
jgi:cytoskeletal protein CcmA (bactofilin family)